MEFHVFEDYLYTFVGPEECWELDITFGEDVSPILAHIQEHFPFEFFIAFDYLKYDPLPYYTIFIFPGPMRDYYDIPTIVRYVPDNFYRDQWIANNYNIEFMCSEDAI